MVTEAEVDGRDNNAIINQRPPVVVHVAYCAQAENLINQISKNNKKKKKLNKTVLKNI